MQIEIHPSQIKPLAVMLADFSKPGVDRIRLKRVQEPLLEPLEVEVTFSTGRVASYFIPEIPLRD